MRNENSNNYFIKQLQKHFPSPSPSPAAAAPAPSHQSKKLIHLLTHKERPDFDGSKSKIAQNCPNIIFAFD